MTQWIEVCAIGEVDEEDVIRFDHGGRTFAVYRSPDDEYFATDGLCTHEHVHLSGGLVMDDIIECPKHNGQFNYKTGAAKRPPVCIDLKTYPVKVEAGKVLIELDEVVEQAGIVIVGAGERGTRAAFALREEGYGPRDPAARQACGYRRQAEIPACAA